jgi:hypothetical protein
MSTKLKTTKNRIKTTKPSFTKKTIKPPIDEDLIKEEETEVLEDIVLTKPDASAKPKLHAIWPILMVVSILSCIGIPFVPVAERILIITLASCFSIISVFMIFRFERLLQKWYIDNPEFTPANMKKRAVEARQERRAGRNERNKQKATHRNSKMAKSNTKSAKKGKPVLLKR